MGISMIGSIGSYLKNMELKQTWQLRKDNGYEKGKMSLEDWMKKQEEKIGFRPPKPQDYTMSSIENKVHAGKSLTPKERKYLQEHNPELLKTADETEAAKRNFEKELKECRTKEDVERLRMKYINASITVLKAVANNPNIPQSKKLEIAWQENGKVMATQEALAKFIKKGDYEKLPTEAEKAEVERLEKEQSEGKLHPEETENTENTENIEQSKDNVTDTEAAEIQPAPDKQTKEVDITLPFEKEVAVDFTQIQKVKRAKVAAAYTTNINEVDVFSSFGITPQTSMVDETV